MIQFTICLPPSLNNAYFNSASRGRIKSSEYRSWCHMVDAFLDRAAYDGGKIKGAYAVHICVPAKMRGDIDNRIKPIIDALVRAGIVEDDSKMHFVSVHRKQEVEADKAHVTVQPWLDS